LQNKEQEYDQREVFFSKIKLPKKAILLFYFSFLMECKSVQTLNGFVRFCVV